MSAQQFLSRDGARIVFEVEGHGPAIVLLHGLSQFRQLWRKYGWVEELASAYTVITPDLRGAGDSEGVSDAGRHAIPFYVDDFEALLAHVGVADAAVWGWSFGGATALQIAAKSAHAKAIIASGTHFGRIFSPEIVRTRLADIEKLEHAVKTGDWEDISDQRRETARITNFDAARARLIAVSDWPLVEPGDIKIPSLLLTGDNDGNAVVKLRESQAHLAQAGVGLHIFEGLNHVDLVAQHATVAPIVRAFLNDKYPGVSGN